MKPSSVFLVSAASAVSAADPKAMPFGLSAPVQILRPRFEPVKNLNEYNVTETTYVENPQPRVHVATRSGSRYVDDDEEGENDYTGFSRNVLNPLNLFKSEKRTTRDCGVFKLDCSHVREVCNNACYYQKCIKKDDSIRYQDYGGDESENAFNRVDAGTTVSSGTPCRNMPLSQKMYDSWLNWHEEDPQLQTDEWPMAAMKQSDFDTLADGDVRNALRCIARKDNKRGGDEYKYFRRGIGYYNKERGGKYADLRTCDTPRVFNGEETFTVEFDLSGFDDDAEIDAVVPYCKPNPDCTNDGRQFHLSKLEYLTSAGNSGRMGWIYDLETMNNYKLTGEDEPIESFQIVVKITGDDRKTYSATVSKYRDGNLEEAGTANDDDLEVDQTLTVQGLPRDLRITPRSDSDGDRVDFIYGDPDSDADKIAYFPFNTNDFGFDNEFDQEDNLYCKLTDLTDDDGDVEGYQYECWFPGW